MRKDRKPENRRKNHRAGICLIESLIALALFLLVTAAAMESYASLRDHFFLIKEKTEIREAVYSSLTRMRLDLLEAGRGLTHEISIGLINAVSIEENGFSMMCGDRLLEPESDLVSGQTSISLQSSAGIGKGRTICVAEGMRGEVLSIAAVEGRRIICSTPLANGYSLGSLRMSLLRETACFLDFPGGTLRRRVNASSAQPLMEETAAFRAEIDETDSLIRLSLTHSRRKEQAYAAAVFPKNMALAKIR